MAEKLLLRNRSSLLKKLNRTLFWYWWNEKLNEFQAVFAIWKVSKLYNGSCNIVICDRFELSIRVSHSDKKGDGA